MCDLFKMIREEWPRLSEKYFRLICGTNQISPDKGHLKLDDWEVGLQNNAEIFVIFGTSGGVQRQN